ncbi:MAG: hypothetical protein FGM16_07650 [Flavobacterium sp.]|nr:hypothetical protein [Flavobacterium sp.]
MKYTFLFLLLVLMGCAQKDVSPKSDCKAPKKKALTMYKMSEMSALMEQMYAENQQLKARILKGDTIGAFPNHFLKIHQAVMTDSTENDAFFKEQAKLFIAAQSQIYKDPKNAQAHFNAGVDACIQCHQVKCAGPISRIKKLYITQ